MRFNEFKPVATKLFELKIPTSSEGPDIANIQKMLSAFDYPVTINGILDDATKQSIAKAQQDIGIPVTGIPDAKTIDAFNTAIQAVPELSSYINSDKTPNTPSNTTPSRPTTTPASELTNAGPAPTTASAKGREVIIGNEKRTGGTISWRTNNPGNVQYGDFARRYGAIGSAMAGDGEPVAIMPTLDHGWKMQMALWRRPKYNNGTINQGCRNWATGVRDYKGISPYTIALADAAGASIHTKVSELSDEQLKNMVKKQAKLEGFKVGTVTTV